ncbi:MAG: nucleotidyltransferase family protein [Deltaproteobacteria bacterium]|nr:nucleotidyltransferase family protein [Deltaproteobacteria bacterium]
MFRPKAILMAGGKGKRLRPYTTVIPKPLMPLGDQSIIELMISQLAKSHFDITITVNHQSDLIRAVIGDGSKWGIPIDYSFETKPLGTMGPLRLIENLPEKFLVMNGDILTDIDFKDLYESHDPTQHLLTVATSRRSEKIDYGILEVDDHDRLTGFREKPSYEYLVSMGIYVLSREVLHLITPEVNFGFDNLMHALLAERAGSVRVVRHEGLWKDIGRPADYTEAIEILEKTEKQ